MKKAEKRSLTASPITARPALSAGSTSESADSTSENAESVYKPKPGDIAGVDLYGKRKDNKVVLGGGDVVDEFPEEVEVCGVIYTLEKVKDQGANDVVWGIYV